MFNKWLENLHRNTQSCYIKLPKLGFLDISAARLVREGRSKKAGGVTLSLSKGRRNKADKTSFLSIFNGWLIYAELC
jgi:hypothetical protein